MSPLQDELEAGLFWADVMLPALGGFSGHIVTTAYAGEFNIRNSCNSAAAFHSKFLPCFFGLVNHYESSKFNQLIYILVCGTLSGFSCEGGLLKRQV